MTLQALFYAIFRLTDILSDPFDFWSPEPFSSLVSKYAIHRNCFGDLYLWCRGWFLEVDPPPPPPFAPHQHQLPPLSSSPIFTPAHHSGRKNVPPCSDSQPPPPPPPKRTKPNARLRAIRPTLVGNVVLFYFSCKAEYIECVTLTCIIAAKLL